MACKTRRASLRRAKTSIDDWCRRHRHLSIKDQHAALHRRLRGHCNSFGVHDNYTSMMRLVEATKRSWYKWLHRRSHRTRLNWERFTDMVRWWPLPRPRITVRMWDGSPRVTSTEEPDGGNLPRPDLARGRERVTARPTLQSHFGSCYRRPFRSATPDNALCACQRPQHAAAACASGAQHGVAWRGFRGLDRWLRRRQDGIARVCEGGGLATAGFRKAGGADLHVPKLRRGNGELRWQSLTRYERCWGPRLKQQVRGSCLGLSLRDLQEIMALTLNEVLSLAACNRIVSRVKAHVEAFKRHPLEPPPPVVIVDGMWVKIASPPGEINVDSLGRRRPVKRKHKRVVEYRKFKKHFSADPSGAQPPKAPLGHP
jgi:hypothetical protein